MLTVDFRWSIDKNIKITYSKKHEDQNHELKILRD